MISVILDANALIMPFQLGLNLDSELERLFGNHEIYVPSSVREELKGLGRNDALSLSDKYNRIKVSKKGDEGVLEAAEKLDGVIVTNDKELKKVKETNIIASLTNCFKVVKKIINSYFETGHRVFYMKSFKY